MVVDVSTWPAWRLNWNITSNNTRAPSDVAWTMLTLGSAGDAFKRNTSMGDLTVMFQKFLRQNKNVTIHEIAEFLGTTNHSALLLADYNYNTTNLPYFINSAATAQPTYPHFVRDPTADALRPVFITLTVIAAGFLAARFYSRWVTEHRILATDWVMLAGYILTLFYGIVSCVVQIYVKTSGVMPWDQTFQINAYLQMYGIITNATYAFPILVIKSSFLLFYYHLTSWRYIRWTCIVVFVLTAINALAACLAQIFEWYQDDYWNHELADLLRPATHDSTARYAGKWPALITGGFNIITDFIIWILPLPLVWKLSLSSGERMFLMANFGIGILATAISAFRLHEVHLHLTWGKIPGSYGGTLLTYAVVEMYFAVICGCVPYIRALVRPALRVKKDTMLQTMSNISHKSDSGAIKEVWLGP